jgi:AraC-like DNA-binding protein
MKLALEKISPAHKSSSFHWIINPKLNDFYFWHFHPEFELVYIEAEEGTRCVGTNISKYKNSDLCLIGSNLPHLNFDYGIKTDYIKTVLHIQPNFLKGAKLQTPELESIHALFEQSKYGIIFGEATKKKVRALFLEIHEQPYFDQFLNVLKLFKILSEAPDIKLLHKKLPQNLYNTKDTNRIQKVYTFIENNFEKKIELEELCALTNLSKAAFCRYFKKMTKLTFTEFLNNYRINEAKMLLMAGNNVSETCYTCGFESLSYFNRTFKKTVGENPIAFKQKVNED